MDGLAPDISIPTACPTLCSSPSTPTSERKKCDPENLNETARACFSTVLYVLWWVMALERGQSCSEMWPAWRRCSSHQFCFPSAGRKSLHNLQGKLCKQTRPLSPSVLDPLHSQFRPRRSEERVAVTGRWTTLVCPVPSPVPDGHAALGTQFNCLFPSAMTSFFSEDVCISELRLHRFFYNYRFVITCLMMTPFAWCIFT